METVLLGKSKEVIIDTNGPVIIIGESINPTRRKKLVSTLQAGNFEYVLELARIQINAMADVLDVNVGFPGVDDVKLLPETVKVIQDKYDIPLCLDSPNPKAIEAALKVAKEKEKYYPGYPDSNAAIVFMTRNGDFWKRITIDENSVSDDYIQSEQLKGYLDELGLTTEILEGQ